MYRYGGMYDDIVFMYAESIENLRQIADAFVEKSTIYKEYSIICECLDSKVDITEKMFLL